MFKPKHMHLNHVSFWESRYTAGHEAFWLVFAVVLLLVFLSLCLESSLETIRSSISCPMSVLPLLLWGSLGEPLAPSLRDYASSSREHQNASEQRVFTWGLFSRFSILWEYTPWSPHPHTHSIPSNLSLPGVKILDRKGKRQGTMLVGGAGLPL